MLREQERVGKKLEEATDTTEQQCESAEEKGWRRGKPEADGLAEESSHAHVARWNRIRQPSALITRNGTIAN